MKKILIALAVILLLVTIIEQFRVSKMLNSEKEYTVKAKVVLVDNSKK